VFVNSLGLPTYEAKELALSRMESTEFGTLSRIIHCVGPEQASFFIVTFKAEELMGYVPPGVQYHLAYGWVRLKHGKMSSRSGNVVLGEWLLNEAKASIYEILKQNESKYTKEEQDEIAEKGAVAAVKYAFLKVSTGQEIAFDLKESVSFDGDSGPYLLYSYARCKSVLRKAQSNGDQVSATATGTTGMNTEERALARHIHFFPEVVRAAATDLSPNVLCTYLFTLAQTFNVFYQKHTIVGEPQRIALTGATAQALHNGLHLLGIATVERM
jgi:arginyl-tRNA synthetase